MTTRNFSTKGLTRAISGLSHQTSSVEEAIGLLQSLLAEKIGGATLVVEPVEEGSSRPIARSISAFLESREYPFRGLYTAPLLIGNRKVGRLMACFGSFGVPDELLPRLTVYVARQLSDVLGRTHGPLSYQEAA